MIKYCGILRSEKYLKAGHEKLLKIIESIENCDLNSVEAMELYNMCMVGDEIFKGAIARKKSVGAHFREDDVNDK